MLSYNGIQGHLATITSQGENAFILTIAPTPNSNRYIYWLGGYQPDDTPLSDEPYSNWHWVNGDPWSYAGSPTDWANNRYGRDRFVLPVGSSENALCLYANNWNDYPKNVPGDCYIVEYDTPSTSSSTDIPEFPSVVVPVAAILGLVVIVGRRKT